VCIKLTGRDYANYVVRSEVSALIYNVESIIVQKINNIDRIDQGSKWPHTLADKERGVRDDVLFDVLKIYFVCQQSRNHKF